MAEPPVIEIREWGRPARRMTLSRPVQFGRECDGVNLADSEVSRRHLRLVPTPTALSVVDLDGRVGIDYGDYARRFGKSIEADFGPVIDGLIRQGLLERTEWGCCLSEDGLGYGNYVFSKFIR